MKFVQSESDAIDFSNPKTGFVLNLIKVTRDVNTNKLVQFINHITLNGPMVQKHKISSVAKQTNINST